MDKIAGKKVWAPMPNTVRATSSMISHGKVNGNERLIYGSGKTVVIREFDALDSADLYQQHTHDVTIARVSDTGFYMASADKSGKLRIWDVVNDEHIKKAEYPLLGGSIRDLAWDGDSKRIAVVGEGRGSYSAVILWDTGSSVGSLTMTKQGNSVDFKKTRPYRLATGSDDFTVSVYSGPPFKIPTNIKEHTRYVNEVRFSPDGGLLASVSSDASVIVYDAMTGEVKGKCGAQNANEGHIGSVTGVCWSPDSSKLLSVSVDGSAKLWDVATLACIATIDAKPATLDLSNSKDIIPFQLLGCIWNAANGIRVVQNGGALLEIDTSTYSIVSRIDGHAKNITCLSTNLLSHQSAASGGIGAFVSSDYGGVMCVWDTATGTARRLDKYREVQINRTVLLADNSLAVFYLDGKYTVVPSEDIQSSLSYATMPKRTPELAQKSIIHWTTQLPLLKDLPCALPSDAIAIPNSKTSGFIVAGMKGIDVVLDSNTGVAFSVPLSYAVTCIASVGATNLLVGGDDGKLHLFTIAVDSFGLLTSGDQLTHQSEHTLPGNASTLSVSGDQTKVCVGMASRHINVYNSTELSTPVAQSVTHTARISATAFLKDSCSQIITASLDGSVTLWNHTTNTYCTAKNAHKGGVTALAQIDASTIASAGSDCTIRTWSI